MLTLNDLSKTLVELTGCQSSEADNFLRELFALAAEMLESEGRVEMPLLGSFDIMDGTIRFHADSKLAAEINSPFEDFTPIEVPEDFEIGSPSAPYEPSVPSDILETSESSETSEPSETSETSDNFDKSDLSAPNEISAPVVVKPEVKDRRALGCCRGMLIGLIGLILGFVGGWFAAQYYLPVPILEQNDIESSVLPAESDLSEIADFSSSDSIIDEPQSHQIVTDTVRVGRFLTTMALRHYGQKEYWVYIYEANPQFGNPNTLPAGTVVIIPPADSLGLIAGDEEKLAEANHKLNEILSRFN